MAFKPVYDYFKAYGLEDRITQFTRNTQSVGDAADLLGVPLGCIAKSIVFKLEERLIMVVCSSEERINMRNFKHIFGVEAPLLEDDKVQRLVGHVVGGVCPFDLPSTIEVYLDMSLRRFPYVYPAAGSCDTAIQLTPAELEIHSQAKGWKYICESSDSFGRHQIYLDMFIE